MGARTLPLRGSLSMVHILSSQFLEVYTALLLHCTQQLPLLHVQGLATHPYFPTSRSLSRVATQWLAHFPHAWRPALPQSSHKSATGALPSSGGPYEAIIGSFPCPGLPSPRKPSQGPQQFSQGYCECVHSHLRKTNVTLCKARVLESLSTSNILRAASCSAHA